MQVEFIKAEWPYVSPLRISNHEWTHADVVRVELTEAGVSGRGEAAGVFYRCESVESLIGELEGVRKELTKGLTRAELQDLLPPGGARSAVDCALWDLESKRSGRRAWEIAGMSSVKSLTTAFTLSVDTPEAMAHAASAAHRYSLLKLKLSGNDDLRRVKAVRAVRPDAELIVDANQGWDVRQLRQFAPRLAELGVRLIEQPLPAGHDEALSGFESPVPLCADESCETTRSLPLLEGKYQYINIKLDKAGGLSEALALVQEAQARNFGLMVGCMGGSSLSMAPAFLVGQFCEFVDLDGPLLCASDMPNPIRYEGSRMDAPGVALWG